MDNLNLNIFNVIILLGVIHGLIFGTIILVNKNLKSKANRFLALTVFSLALSNLQYLLYDFNILKKSFSKFFFIPFEFLILPMFFLFVKNYLQNRYSNKLLFLLTFPFLFASLNQILTGILGFNNLFLNVTHSILEYFAAVFTITLIVFIFYIIKKYELKIRKLDYKYIPIQTIWLKQLLIFGLFLCIVWFISLIFFKDYLGQDLYPFYPLWIGISILLYWIGYTSIIKNTIYKQRNTIRANKKNTKTNLSKTTIESIEKLLVEEREYLNPLLSLELIANKLNLSVSHISKTINKDKEMSFKDYVNRLRLEEAKKILKNKDYEKYTIVAIALECGFNSKSAFYNAFKKEFSTTPTKYRIK